MNTLEMDAYKAEAKKREAALKGQEGEMTKEEILSDLEEAFQTAKLVREGKVKGRPIEMLLNEL